MDGERLRFECCRSLIHGWLSSLISRYASAIRRHKCFVSMRLFRNGKLAHRACDPTTWMRTSTLADRLTSGGLMNATLQNGARVRCRRPFLTRPSCLLKLTRSRSVTHFRTPALLSGHFLSFTSFLQSEPLYTYTTTFA